jgi:putative glutamine amidotransferase
MAIKFSIPMIGICRGAQLLCVANGGKLVQDVANHRTRHLMHTISDHSFQVTSTHHQMMAPEGVYSVLGWSDVCNSWAGMPAGYPTNPKRTEEKDVEVVWWRDTNSLAFQYHPEQMDGQSDGQKYFINTVKTFLSESRA